MCHTLAGRRFRAAGFAAAIVLAVAAAPASAQIVINPTFDSSITNDPNALAIETGITAAVAQYATLFSDNLTVNIYFMETTSTLGSSSNARVQVDYPTFRSDLAAKPRTATKQAALTALPIQSTSPADGNTLMWVTTANARALGINAGSGTDSIVSLDTAMMNLTRVSIDPAKYDLQAVVQHEVDEALGLGSGLDLTSNRLSKPEDLYRYSAPGVRSYTTSSSASSFFSVDGQGMQMAFSQAGGSADYGDWTPSGTAHVQDAFGTPGATPNLNVEITALDAIGFTPVPEPSSLALVALGALAWARCRGRHRVATSL
jgi:hypothetical protein